MQHANINRPYGLMVHDLGIRVAAKGMKEAACLTFLREANSDDAQGYLIARPMVAEDLVTS